MHTYLQWSLRQLFVMVFQPTQFHREVNACYAETPRLWAAGGYLLRMLPWIVMLAVFGTLVVGYIFEASGVFFGWEPSWRGVVVGVALGMVAGVAEAVVGGVALGVVRGVGEGVGGGLVSGMAFGGVIGMAVSVIFGVTKGGCLVD